MKRKNKILIIVLFIVMVSLFNTVLFLSQISSVQPNQSGSEVIPLKNNFIKKINIHSSIDTLTWRKEGASEIVNFPFCDPGDSLLVWLQPVAACSLISIRFKPVNFVGTVILDIWDASHYEPLIYSTDSTDMKGRWGTFEPITCGSCWYPDLSDHSPLGWSETDPDRHFWGPCSCHVTRSDSNSWVDIPATSAPQGNIDIGEDPFYIGGCFFTTSGCGFHTQEDYPRNGPYSFFKFYSSPGGPAPNDGWFLRSYFPWFEVIVKYYESPTSIQNDSVEPLPSHFRLFQNYPNPFNVTTDIRYQIADYGSPYTASLKIYNILGQTIKTMVDEVQEEGTYCIQWDAKDEDENDVGSGVYFYRLMAGDFVETRRMLMLK
ncbi:MAG: T9SS type A sorting domain-containing protein [Gemmatimonadota bacterium]|nr:MAG: T9SS type A sorting domain-containing protein [Gemmatimonadota bacterium]